MLLNSTAAAWTASPLDTCLDRLGVCEGTVSVCESRNSILEAELVLLRHLYVIIAMACTIGRPGGHHCIAPLLACQSGGCGGGVSPRPLPRLCVAPHLEGGSLALRPCVRSARGSSGCRGDGGRCRQDGRQSRSAGGSPVRLHPSSSCCGPHLPQPTVWSCVRSSA
jgi:hypothetical protein